MHWIQKDSSEGHLKLSSNMSVVLSLRTRGSTDQLHVSCVLILRCSIKFKYLIYEKRDLTHTSVIWGGGMEILQNFKIP